MLVDLCLIFSCQLIYFLGQGKNKYIQPCIPGCKFSILILAIVEDGIYVEHIKMLTKSAGSWEIMLIKWGETTKQAT